MAKTPTKTRVKKVVKKAARKTGKVTKLKAISKTGVKERSPAKKLALVPPPTDAATGTSAIWDLLKARRAQLEAQRDEGTAKKMHQDSRRPFEKHRTRFAKFAGPRRRAS